MYGLVQQHAAMLAFVEAFWVMGVAFLLMLPLLPLLQYSKPAKPSAEVPDIPKGWLDDLEHEAREEEHLVAH